MIIVNQTISHLKQVQTVHLGQFIVEMLQV